jgi:hypothetical protein
VAPSLSACGCCCCCGGAFVVCFSACVAVATRVGEARLRARPTSSSSSPFLSARHPSCLFPGQLSATLLLLLLFFLPLFLSALVRFLTSLSSRWCFLCLSLSRITSFSFFRDLVSPPLPAIASAFFLLPFPGLCVCFRLSGEWSICFVSRFELPTVLLFCGKKGGGVGGGGRGPGWGF